MRCQVLYLLNIKTVGRPRYSTEHRGVIFLRCLLQVSLKQGKIRGHHRPCYPCYNLGTRAILVVLLYITRFRWIRVSYSPWIDQKRHRGSKLSIISDQCAYLASNLISSERESANNSNKYIHSTMYLATVLRVSTVRRNLII